MLFIDVWYVKIAYGWRNLVGEGRAQKSYASLKPPKMVKSVNSIMKIEL